MGQSYFRPRHRIWQIKRGVMSDLLHIIVHFALNDENCLENVAPDETSEYAAPDETADDATPDETAANAAPHGLNDIIDLARKLPSGLDDPMAFSKLIVEREELRATLCNECYAAERPPTSGPGQSIGPTSTTRRHQP